MEKTKPEAIFEAFKAIGTPSASVLKQKLSEADNSLRRTDGLSARERLASLFDAGTFMECGTFVRRDGADAFEGVICGWGAVNGRLAYAFSQDYSRSKGALTAAHAKKIENIYKLALENGAPLFGIFDSAGALLPEGVNALAGYGTLMNCAAKASGIIPQIAVIPGVCSGSAAVFAEMFDFVITNEKNGKISFNAPFALNNKIGNGNFAAENGIAALCGKDDAECIAKARQLASFLPLNNVEGTVENVPSDNPNRIIDFTSCGGDSDKIAREISDDSQYFPLYEKFSPEMSCGFITLNGVVCGYVANNKSVNGGLLTANAARKAASFVSFCDSFDIPVITLLDSAGTDVSIEAEATPYGIELAKLAFAYSTAKTALITVITGETYGAHFAIMGSKAIGADVVFALDTAKIGAMSASRAVAFLQNDKVSNTVSRESLEKEWDETVNSPVSAATSGEIDDIISSEELRCRISGALMMLLAKSKGTPSRRHIKMPL